ncbi:MAG: hypothetical protein V3W05_07705, partial [candidate division NC10 bacterium]
DSRLASPGKVARALQVLPTNQIREENWMSSGGRGELGLDPAEPGLRVRRLSDRSGAQVGVAGLRPG